MRGWHANTLTTAALKRAGAPQICVDPHDRSCRRYEEVSRAQIERSASVSRVRVRRGQTLEMHGKMRRCEAQLSPGAATRSAARLRYAHLP